MSDASALFGEETASPAPLRARHALLKRLADVVSLPASRVNAFERAVTGDLLVEMLRLATPEERRRVAARLAPLAELPNSVSRLLLRDAPAIAGLLIEQCASLTDADLITVIRSRGQGHIRAVSDRAEVSEALSDAIVEHGDDEALGALLRNDGARLSRAASETA
ncbi:hypothetical protein LTR94_032867, partial [Friedmanniomyces endolithicus]